MCISNIYEIVSDFRPNNINSIQKKKKKLHEMTEIVNVSTILLLFVISNNVKVIRHFFLFLDRRVIFQIWQMIFSRKFVRIHKTYVRTYVFQMVFLYSIISKDFFIVFTVLEGQTKIDLGNSSSFLTLSSSFFNSFIYNFESYENRSPLALFGRYIVDIKFSI